VAGPAGAQGELFLSFDDCSAAAPARNKVLDCASGADSTDIIASVATVAALTGVFADLGYMDMTVGSNWAVMPAFWHFDVGGCAYGDWNFSTNFPEPPAMCYDLWSGNASTAGQYGGIAGAHPDGNRARVKWSSTLAPELAATLPAGTEAYVCRMTIRQAHLPACAQGCSDLACLRFTHEEFATLGGVPYVIEGSGTEPLYINCPGPLWLCCVVPARPSTWGEVKALYR
jgi:hypothetical protein